MLAIDVVNRLVENLAKYTDAFTDSMEVASIACDGSDVATVSTAAPHNVLEGSNIGIMGAGTPVNIIQHVRDGDYATLTTSPYHDLSLSSKDIAAGRNTITINGADQADLNGDFTLLSVPNRETLVIDVTGTTSQVMTGAPLVVNGGANRFNGYFVAQNITEYTFDILLSSPYSVNAAGAPVLVTSYRIGRVADIVHYLENVYTKKDTTESVIVVVLGDVVLSKNRDELTDAASSQQDANDFHAFVIQNCSVYLIIPSTSVVAGGGIRDTVESEYVPAVFKSLLLAELNSGFAAPDDYQLTFTNHGLFSYGTINGRAIYAHEINFQMLAQLEAADGSYTSVNTALRDVDYSIAPTSVGGFDGGLLTANVNTDQDPIND